MNILMKTTRRISPRMKKLEKFRIQIDDIILLIYILLII